MRHRQVVGEEPGDAALGAGGELVAQPHVGERSAHHDLVVAAAAAVAVEVGGLDAVVGEVLAGRAVELDGTGGGDVVGGDAVAEHGEDARGADVLDRRGGCGHAVEVRRLADVGGVRLPAVGVAERELEVLPVLVAVRDGGVLLAEHRGVDGACDGRGDLGLGGPDVAQVDGLAVLIVAERLRSRSRGRCGRRERRRRPAAGSSGSWRGPRGRCGPRSCDCRRARRRRRGRGLRWPCRRRWAAGRSCRCRWCSRSRRPGSGAASR